MTEASSHRLAHRSALQVAGRAVGLIALAVHLGLAARFLSVDGLAAFFAGYAVLGIAGALSEFGIGNTMVLELADGRTPRQVLKAAYPAVLVLGSVAVAAGVVFLAAVGGGALAAFAFLLPWFVIGRVILPMVAIEQWEHRFTRIAVSETLGRVVAAVTLGGLYVIGGSWSSDQRLAAVCLALAAGAVVSVAVLISRSVLPTGWASPWPMIRQALPIGLTNGASFVHARVDQLILAAFGLTVALAEYGVAYRVVDAALAGSIAVGVVAFPILGRAAHGQRAEVGQMLFGIVGALGLTLAVATYWLAEPIVKVLGGSEYADAAWVLRLLTPVILISTVNLVPAQIALASRRAPVLLRIALVGLVLNVGLNLVLVPTYEARGAAWVSVITEGLGLVLVSVVAERAVPGSVNGYRLAALVAGVVGLTFGVTAATDSSVVAGIPIAAVSAAVTIWALVAPLRLVLKDAKRNAYPLRGAERLA